MSPLVADLPGSGTFARGVHPAGNKALSDQTAIETVATPKLVKIALQQHLGAPCESLVKSKQEVVVGEEIGSVDAFVTSPVHASINGVVARVGAVTLPNGRHVKSIPIKAGEEQLEGQALVDDLFGGDWELGSLTDHDPQDIMVAVKKAGIVGQGGAAFPTHVKLARNPEKPVDTLLVNGCECEPYLTADHRVMLEAPVPVIAGARLAAHACGAERVVIAIEDNKPDAVKAMAEAAEGTGVIVTPVKTKYPMGGERQVIPAVLKREVPTGGLPLDIGVVVINVATAAAMARAVLRGKALTHRVVTMTGRGLERPANLLVPVGISYQELIDHCGGLRADAARVIAGGPMMGFTMGLLDAPVTKGTSGVVVLTHDDVRAADETACVRCGRCVDICPLNLVPTRLALASKHRDWELARRYHLQACMECGCCAYVCPANIPLVQLIRMGKAELPRD